MNKEIEVSLPFGMMVVHSGGGTAFHHVDETCVSYCIYAGTAISFHTSSYKIWAKLGTVIPITTLPKKKRASLVRALFAPLL